MSDDMSDMNLEEMAEKLSNTNSIRDLKKQIREKAAKEEAERRLQRLKEISEQAERNSEARRVAIAKLADVPEEVGGTIVYEGVCYPGRVEDFCRPLTEEQKRYIETHVGSGPEKTYWASNPLVAMHAAHNFRHNPEAIITAELVTPGYSQTCLPWHRKLLCATTALQQVAPSVNEKPGAHAEEVTELWRKATGQRLMPRPKLSNDSDLIKSRSSSGNLTSRNSDVPSSFHAPRYDVKQDDLIKHCFMSERPQSIVTEEMERGAEQDTWNWRNPVLDSGRITCRLHCETAPALIWGHIKIWAIHGVHVDEQIVLRPETQTPDQIMKQERNEEVRRIRMERYGMMRLMEHSETLDRRDNFIENTKEALVQLMRMRFLICHCPSTARVYALQVPVTIGNCEEAQTWLWSGSSLGLRLNSIGRS